MDLFIDGAALARTRATLEGIRETLGGAAAAMSSTPADVTGHEGMAQRLAGFGSEWSHGIDELAEVSGNGAQGLQAIAEAFAEADAELTAALQVESAPGDGPVAV